MAGLGSLLGEGSTAAQFLLWGVAYGFAQALLQPEFVALQQDIWRQQPIQIFSPEILADMVVKNIVTQDAGANEAADSGLDGAHFANLVLNTGEPPGLETVLEAARRSIIAWDYVDPETPSVEGAIRTSHIYDYWYSALRQMGDVSQPNGGIPISPADAVEATLRGQRPQPDMEAEAGLSALNAERFQILLDTAGRPPAPGELGTLLNRQLIPLEGVGPDVTSYQQGIYEGDNKDKWWELLSRTAEYIPPPRSITTLESHGVIDAADAATLYQYNGLTPQLAGIYAASAVATKIAGNKALTAANVEKLYYDRLIDAATATAQLGDLGYAPATAAYVLELQDFNRAAVTFNAAVTTVGRLYTSRKVDRAATVAALTQLDVPAAAISQYMGVWDTEAAANVKTLTEGQITAALYYGVMSQAEAQAALEAIGYTPYDAWVVLSDRTHGPLPNQPAPGPLSGLGVPTTEGA